MLLHSLSGKFLELLINSGAIPAKPGEFPREPSLMVNWIFPRLKSCLDIIASKTSSSHQISIKSDARGFFGRDMQVKIELLNFAFFN